MTPRPKRAGAFSLLELLVSISITALLAGVLLPTLAGAREAARRGECVSNIRQLAIAAHAYADDHRGLLPPGAPDFLRNLVRWHGSREHPSERFRAGGGSLTEYLGDQPDVGTLRAIRRCPTFVPTLQALSETSAGFELACGGYGYNNTFLGVQRRRAGGVYPIVTDRSGSQLALQLNPAKTICFSDSAFASDEGPGGVIEYSFVEPRFWPDRPGARADPSIHFRHANGASIAWLDTHVSGERLSFSWSSGLYGVDAGEVGIGFIGAADDNSLYGEP